LKNNLLEKIKSRNAHVGVVGLGYVGLPLLLRFSEVGYRVLGFDTDALKVDMLNTGQSYIEHIDSCRVADAKDAGFLATDVFSRISELDVIVLCLPTPLNQYREPDLSFVTQTVDKIVPFLHTSQMVSLESTTYPGTTEEELLPRIENAGLKVGEDVFLVYSPEREDPGNKDYTTATIPKICGGVTAACLEVGVAMYEEVIDTVVPVSSTRAAEMTKLLENIHRAVNIGLVNEMKIVADAMEVDIHEVVAAAATKPFGFTPYTPGPGLGGHCIPIDPFYLTWKAREYGLNTRFIELAGEVNKAMPAWVIDKLTEALNDRCKAVRGSKILVLGVAYKKNVDDMRESPSIELLEILREKGAEVAYSDPHVPEFPVLREHVFELQSLDLTAQSIAEFDVVLLATDHDLFDYDLIREHAAVVVDTRGKYRQKFEGLVQA
jgi:UDP-N-acetyl-D-glucosamine dehydrogenase